MKHQSKAQQQKLFTEKREVLINKEMLVKRVAQLADQITSEYWGKKVTFICIMKGAVYFFTDLTRHVRLETEMEFIRAKSYSDEESTGKVEFKWELDNPVTGKDVIVVEDIIDTGETLAKTLDYLEEQHPNTLKLCVLLDKPERRKVEGIKVDYIGFTIPDRFVIGYGLDLNEKYRNLPSIECIVRSEEEMFKVKKEKEDLKFQLKK